MRNPFLRALTSLGISLGLAALSVAIFLIGVHTNLITFSITPHDGVEMTSALAYLIGLTAVMVGLVTVVFYGLILDPGRQSRYHDPII